MRWLGKTNYVEGSNGLSGTRRRPAEGQMRKTGSPETAAGLKTEHRHQMICARHKLAIDAGNVLG
jgi:hypothetical protein